MFRSPKPDLDAATGLANGCLIAIAIWVVVVAVVAVIAYFAGWL